MAGSKSTVTGEDFYGPYDAQNYAAEMAPALGMQTVPSLNIVYTEEKGYVTADISKAEGLHELKLSGDDQGSVTRRNSGFGFRDEISSDVEKGR